MNIIPMLIIDSGTLGILRYGVEIGKGAVVSTTASVYKIVESLIVV